MVPAMIVKRSYQHHGAWCWYVEQHWKSKSLDQKRDITEVVRYRLVWMRKPGCCLGGNSARSTLSSKSKVFTRQRRHSVFAIRGSLQVVQLHGTTFPQKRRMDWAASNLSKGKKLSGSWLRTILIRASTSPKPFGRKWDGCDLSTWQAMIRLSATYGQVRWTKSNQII